MLRVSADLVDGPAALSSPSVLHFELMPQKVLSWLTKKTIQRLILNTDMMTLSFLHLFSQTFTSEIQMLKAKRGLFSPTLGLSLPLHCYAVPELAHFFYSSQSLLVFLQHDFYLFLFSD